MRADSRGQYLHSKAVTRGQGNCLLRYMLMRLDDSSFGTEAMAHGDASAEGIGLMHSACRAGFFAAVNGARRGSGHSAERVDITSPSHNDRTQLLCRATQHQCPSAERAADQRGTCTLQQSIDGCDPQTLVASCMAAAGLPLRPTTAGLRFGE